MTTPRPVFEHPGDGPWEPFVDVGLLSSADVAAVPLLAPRFGESRPSSTLMSGSMPLAWIERPDGV